MSKAKLAYAIWTWGLQRKEQLIQAVTDMKAVGFPYFESVCHTVALFKALVKRYPNVSFLLGHSGGGDKGRREAEELAQKHPNVYLEWCGSFCSTILWEETLRKVNPRQVVFGTDATAHDFNWELGRLLSLDIPNKILVPILGGNMRRILARRKR